MRMSEQEWHEAWLRATPEWVDANMDDLVKEGYAPMGVGAPVTAEHVGYFGGVLPASVLHLWERFGFDGFGAGRWWFTDPYRWAPVVEAWLGGTAIPFPHQRWWCLARSATGTMRLWGGGLRPRSDPHPRPGVGASRRSQRLQDVGRGDA
ncbi:GAD-like domain-containing protein [Actinomyces wuliandei]|uniref:GAD-like domain-containing protein n=1 Tax=Actinomyces wuliandei TaxID=2057743 RepID=UPI0013E3FB89|nr:GAD-like domain-containing protein [Actinomyces wuliandei]